MDITTVEGDLPAQPVEAIVNPWNRNLIPEESEQLMREALVEVQSPVQVLLVRYRPR